MTALVYDADGIRIYLGDCLDLLPTLPGDVLAFDPPYGTDEHGGYGRRQLGLQTIANDNDTLVRDTVLRIWGPRTALVFASPKRPEPPGPWSWRLVWDKGAAGLGAPWRWAHEMIYCRGDWHNEPGVSSVLRYPPERAMRDRYHPHEKPVPLMIALLQGTKGTVVDATMGSGSTLVAARELGRKAIGIELDPSHVKTAVARLQQRTLFGLGS